MLIKVHSELNWKRVVEESDAAITRDELKDIRRESCCPAVFGILFESSSEFCHNEGWLGPRKDFDVLIKLVMISGQHFFTKIYLSLQNHGS